MPGIRHFFGLDVGSGRLVDIHAHEWLLVGDDATKNYHLPIEEAYLGSAERDGVFAIPSPEFEWILLVVRLMLKHASPEAILTGRDGCRPTSASSWTTSRGGSVERACGVCCTMFRSSTNASWRSLRTGA